MRSLLASFLVPLNLLGIIPIFSYFSSFSTALISMLVMAALLESRPFCASCSSIARSPASVALTTCSAEGGSASAGWDEGFDQQ